MFVVLVTDLLFHNPSIFHFSSTKVVDKKISEWLVVYETLAIRERSLSPVALISIGWDFRADIISGARIIDGVQIH